MALSALVSPPCGAGEKHTSHPEPVKPGGISIPRILPQPIQNSGLATCKGLQSPFSPLRTDRNPTDTLYRLTFAISPTSPVPTSSRTLSRRSGVTPTTATHSSKSRACIAALIVLQASRKVAPVVRTSSSTIASFAPAGKRPGWARNEPWTLRPRSQLDTRVCGGRWSLLSMCETRTPVTALTPDAITAVWSICRTIVRSHGVGTGISTHDSRGTFARSSSAATAAPSSRPTSRPRVRHRVNLIS